MMRPNNFLHRLTPPRRDVLVAAAILVLVAATSPHTASAAAVIPEPEQSVVSADATARLPDGKVLALLPSPDGKRLVISRTSRPMTLNDFAESVPLFGKDGKIAAKNPKSVRLEVAGETVHLVCESKGGLTWYTTALPLRPESQWQNQTLESPGDLEVQDVVRDQRDRVFAIVRQKSPDRAGWTLNVATLQEKGPQRVKIAESAEGLANARGAVADDNSIAIVWEGGTELAPRVMRAQLGADGTTVSPAVFCHDGGCPTVACAGGRTFVASEQPGGLIRVDWYGRDGSQGSQVLHGRAGYRPALAVDVHGVAWLFAVGLEQRGLFYRRFMGSGFGDECECGGAPGTWTLSLGYSVQPVVREHDDGFALLAGEYIEEPKEYRYRFHDVQVPRYSVRDGRHVLFMDLLEVADLESLQQGVNSAARSDANPLNLNGPPGSPDAAVAGYACVIYENGKFRLWYNADSDEPGRGWVICYAESNDGIHWTKPELGLVNYKGSKKNNLLFPIEYKTSAPFIFKDEQESDPQRRYKMCFEAAFQGATCAYLGLSADGIHWQWPPHPLWGKSPAMPAAKRSVKGFHPWHEPLSSFFYDPVAWHPDYRWKAYGQDAYAGYPHFDPRPVRNLSLAHGATPYDLAGFDGNPVMEPRVGYHEDQIHGGLVQPYQGMYVCLYQHWWGDDWNVDLRLAASRDGIHFVRVKPKRSVLPLGTPGSWDSGMVCTPNQLLHHDGKLWLYYRGSVGTLATGRIIQEHADEPKKQEEAWSMLTGLARLREDGFAYLTPAAPEYLAQPPRTTTVPNYRLDTTGRVTTIPIDAAGIGERSLHVNVEFFAPGVARLRAQLRDADTGKVIEGYSFNESGALREASLDRKMTWKGSADLGGVKAKRVRVEFELLGTLDQPKLYSFWFQ